MEIKLEQTVADIVATEIQTAHVFKKYGIDFCCNGGITLERACTKNGIDFEQLKSELEHACYFRSAKPDYQQWSPGFLCDYIVNTHHHFVKQSIELLNAYSEKVFKVHAQNHQPLGEIKELYQALAAELLMHMQKEEMILFPYIKELELTIHQKQPMHAPTFGTIENPLRMMHAEHESAGSMLKQIELLTNHYQAPDWACNTFKAFYDKLAAFQDDLHIHIHLENNVLFPQALAMEKSLPSKTL